MLASKGDRMQQGQAPARVYSRTAAALRTCEALAAAVATQEAPLLVGETGGGKTTAVEQLAAEVGAELTCLNLSQQSDIEDLIGGFRPTRPGDTLLPLLGSFHRLVELTWTKGANQAFLSRVDRAAERQRWPQLLHGFQVAIQKVQARE